MTDAASQATPSRDEGAARLAWALLALGWLAMFVPSYWSAARGLWQTDEYGHGPLILAIAGWLLWRARAGIWAARSQPAAVAGTLVFGLGLLCYVFGRIFTISSIEFAAQPLVVAGILLLLGGPASLGAVWFAVFFLCFMIPLPQTLVDAATGPLKQVISQTVVDLLHGVGYPVGRAGVVITAGRYQLLMADACSGLNSIVSLFAMSALYMYLMRRHGTVHNLVLAASILPIAVAANMVRVVLLVLVTYHLGDDAGQGFTHGAAGLLVFLVALGLLVLLDHAVLRLRRPRVLGPDGGAGNGDGT